MYRVELKGKSLRSSSLAVFTVPNVPCGVERTFTVKPCWGSCPVPNVPCGVERPSVGGKPFIASKFLMYRVELKDQKAGLRWGLAVLFLMYRVELKGESL